MDENDKLRAGVLPANPREGGTPMNEQAKRTAAEQPRILTVKQLLVDSMDRAFSREPRLSCTTGHFRLDGATGGMRPGHVWVFGADTNWGKSSWLVSIADENIKAGKRVLIVSFEDDESIYGDRLLARRARVRATNLRDRRLEGEEFERVTAAVNEAEDIPVYLDGRGKTVEQIVKHVDHLIREESIDLVTYDYLQECKSAKRYQDERVKFREVAAQLRGVIKDNKKTGVIFSQITVSDTKKYPDKHSIRECRDVSNAAEVVVLGFTPTEDIREGNDKNGRVLISAGTKTIKVDKCKDGPKGYLVAMDWDEHSACFNVVEDPAAEHYRAASRVSDELGGEFDYEGE